jgi:serine/threonine-protein kinase
MGEIFLARQTGPNGFDRACVVKRMHPHFEVDPDTSAMFLEEAQLSALITHPYVAQVYDFGNIDGAFYLAMEYVDGPPLTAIIKHFRSTGRFVPLDFVCRVVSQAAQALEHAHRLKDGSGAPLELIHRDISPQNILVSRDGLSKVIDFGIAKARTSQKRTQAGLVRGKVGYMSPEQMQGLPLDARTDIYSLGLVMYELLTGRHAVLGDNDVEIIANARVRSWPAADLVRPDAPAALMQVLDKALAADREQRYRTMSDFSKALEAVISARAWQPGAQRMGLIAAEVLDPKPKGPSGFEEATDTDITAHRAGAVTAPHEALAEPSLRRTAPGHPRLSEPPDAAAERSQRPTAPDQPRLDDPPRPLSGWVVAAIAASVVVVVGLIVVALFNGAKTAPDVQMPPPGPPPVVSTDAGRAP